MTSPGSCSAPPGRSKFPPHGELPGRSSSYDREWSGPVVVSETTPLIPPEGTVQWHLRWSAVSSFITTNQRRPRHRMALVMVYNGERKAARVEDEVTR